MPPTGRSLAFASSLAAAAAQVCDPPVGMPEAETVSFVAGILATADGNVPALLAGGGVGPALGVAMGVALYAGLLGIPAGDLFKVTSWMVLLLAAGLATQPETDYPNNSLKNGAVGED